ncbi:MAG: hypothetical protein MZV64_15240 [Ignavibacteriales bacterium]|nr:hypothetical protein [Ignavibacteriales bacterium]
MAAPRTTLITRPRMSALIVNSRMVGRRRARRARGRRPRVAWTRWSAS